MWCVLCNDSRLWILVFWCLPPDYDCDYHHFASWVPGVGTIHARIQGMFSNHNTYDIGRLGAMAMHAVNPDDAAVFYTGACLRM